MPATAITGTHTKQFISTRHPWSSWAGGVFVRGSDRDEADLVRRVVLPSYRTNTRKVIAGQRSANTGDHVVDVANE